MAEAVACLAVLVAQVEMVAVPRLVGPAAVVLAAELVESAEQSRAQTGWASLVRRVAELVC